MTAELAWPLAQQQDKRTCVAAMALLCENLHHLAPRPGHMLAQITLHLRLLGVQAYVHVLPCLSSAAHVHMSHAAACQVHAALK